MRFEQLRLQRDFTATVALREAVERIGAAQGVSAEERFDLQLAVTEAVANALEHGPDEEVEVLVRFGAGFVEIEVWSRGHFHLESTELPPDDAEGGRGLPLMASLVDELTLDATPDGTTVRMRKFTGRESGPAA